MAGGICKVGREGKGASEGRGTEAGQGKAKQEHSDERHTTGPASDRRCGLITRCGIGQVNAMLNSILPPLCPHAVIIGLDSHQQ